MSDDQALQDAVAAELDWDPSLDAARIEATAEDGIVTLTGHVATYPAQRAAVAAALRVNGVKIVTDDLEVRLPARPSTPTRPSPSSPSTASPGTSPSPRAPSRSPS